MAEARGSLLDRPHLVDRASVERLHSALVTGEPSGRRLLMCRRAQSWLDAPIAEALADARSADAKLAKEALVCLQVKASTALGLQSGPDWSERAAAFDARERTSCEQVELGRYHRAVWLTQQLGNPDVEAFEPDEIALQAELDRRKSRHDALLACTTPGDVQAVALDGLDELLAEYLALRNSARADNRTLPHLCFYAASASFALGRGRALAGQLRVASLAFDQAALCYSAAAEQDQAYAAREEAERTRFAAQADVDGASLDDLRRMAEGIVEPVERARTLMRLSHRAGEANDSFGALAHAEAALSALEQAGFAEPVRDGFVQTTRSWIDTACTRASGNQVIRLLLWVGITLLQTKALRWRARPETDTAESHVDSDTLTALLKAIAAEPAIVRDEVRRGLAEFGIASAEEVQHLPSRTEAATALQRRIGNANDLTEADALVAEARAIGMPSLVAQALLQQASLRHEADDGAGCIAASLEGEAVLLPGNASAETLIGLPAFDILVELRNHRVCAHADARDNQAVFDCAWATVRLIEMARYRVSDPYQQASFLASRTTFYELAAFSSYRLQRWDELLTVMDLFKARSAVRNRLATAPPGDTDGLAREMQEITDALARASAEDRPALRARRQALWEVSTVTRLANARMADMPELNVAAIQGALTPDEAVISWSFVASNVLIVLALDAKRLHAEHVVLNEPDLATLGRYLDAMTAGQLDVRALGSTVARIGEMMLPAGTRAFIATATRLVFSPHRRLNLVPLHAARVDDHYLIERASVRYVPNLASLVLPWRGAGIGLAAIGLNQSDLPNTGKLAHAEDETRRVAACWAAQGEPVTCLLGADATVAAVAKLDLGARRVVHIATHGTSVFAGEARADPFESFLLLRDGTLDALTVSQLQLQAEVVVMSACNSGQRALSVRGLDELPGDDMFGLQAAMLQAGAKNVVGTLWPLIDESAARMLPALQAGLAAGICPDLALQNAIKLELSVAPPQYIFGWAPLFLSSMGRTIATAGAAKMPELVLHFEADSKADLVALAKALQTRGEGLAEVEAASTEVKVSRSMIPEVLMVLTMAPTVLATSAGALESVQRIVKALKEIAEETGLSHVRVEAGMAQVSGEQLTAAQAKEALGG